MESNRKRRGLKGGKVVMSFHRSPKPSSVAYSGKGKPSPSPVAALGFMVEDQLVIPSAPKPKASFGKKEVGSEFKSSFDAAGGGGGGGGGGGEHYGDESVDKRAAMYISVVQERFRLEQIEAEWRKY